MPSVWSRIPPEISQEITSHNADDVPSLRAMCLVSKAMRSSAIIDLFSIIHFVCVEDFAWWLEMTDRTPSLGSVVKKVKFSDPTRGWIKRHRGIQSPTRLDDCDEPPVIHPIPTVRIIELKAGMVLPPMLIAHMTLFPNTEKLYLRDMHLDSMSTITSILGAFGKLKVLHLSSVLMEDDGIASKLAELARIHSKVPPSSIVPPSSFDLTGLEELVIKGCYDEDEEDAHDFLIDVMTKSPPQALRSLTLGGVHNEEPCSIKCIEKLLRVGAPSLVNLTIEPEFGFEVNQNHTVLQMFKGLPPFPAPDSLTIWLRANRQAEYVLNVLKVAPNVTTLIFRISLYFEEDRGRSLGAILRVVFPCGGSGGMKTALKRKFLLLKRVGFHFCIPHNSDLHFRRGARRRMERWLKERLEKTGADVAEYLELKWLDEDLSPVSYDNTTGKPPWKFVCKPGREEPETEDSDCDCDKETGYDSEKPEPPTDEEPPSDYYDSDCERFDLDFWNNQV
ncbi:hypothetical protein C8R43DRAFT_1191477 [Mycena crocata]|nr:hypothetical protein C8R43DRAFT_1191477 [Mycena crocata]